MSLSAFNRMRRLQAQQAAEEAAKVKTPPEDKNLDEMTYQELRALAKDRGIEGYHKLNTEELREVLKGGGNDGGNKEAESDSEGQGNTEKQGDEGQAGEESGTDKEGD